jgi:hypothetical protein
MKRSKVLPGHELALSSVKVHPHILKRFQEQAIHRITFQSLVNRALHLYNEDIEFRRTITSCTALIPSGSL